MNIDNLIKINTSVFSEEYHEARLEVFIHNINILKYIYQSETKPRTATGNLDLLFEYLEETLKFIHFDTPFPHPIEGQSACELDRNARQFDSDDDDEFDSYFDPLDEWSQEHSWLLNRLDIYLANVMFRKVDDCIEISWDNRDLYDDVQFISLEGCVRIPCDEYRRVILKAIEDYHQLWDKR